MKARWGSIETAWQPVARVHHPCCLAEQTNPKDVLPPSRPAHQQVAPACRAAGRQHVGQRHGGQWAHAREVGSCTLRCIRHQLAARQTVHKVGGQAAAQPGQARAAVAIARLLLSLLVNLWR